MKGLMYKDLTMVLHYYWSMVVLVACSFACEAFGGIVTLSMLSATIVGMLATSIGAYEEKFKWDSYCATLPYTDAEIVSVKYIINFVGSVSVALLLFLGALIKIFFFNRTGTADLSGALSHFMIILIVGLVWGLVMPIMFRYGSEKSRWVLCIMGGICGGCIGFAGTTLNVITMDVFGYFNKYLAIALAVIFILYAGSWLLSIKWYKKRRI